MVKLKITLKYGAIECIKSNFAEAMNYISELKASGYIVTSYEVSR